MLEFLHGVAGAVGQLIGLGSAFDGTGFTAVGAIRHEVTRDSLQQGGEELLPLFWERAWAMASKPDSELLAPPNPKDLEELENQAILDALSKSMEARRFYCSHWEWHNKPMKERGILTEFLKEFEAQKHKTLVEYPIFPRGPGEDPPDFHGQDHDGNSIGIELTELVDERTVKQRQKDRKLEYKHYTPAEAVARIQDRIDDKGRKTYKGGPYQRIILLIFTDEYFLEPSDVLNAIRSHRFIKGGNIQEAYLLYSYQASTETCPFIVLQMVGATPPSPFQ